MVVRRLHAIHIRKQPHCFVVFQQPLAKSPHFFVRPIAPALHHTTFTTKRLDEMVAWYERAVGLVPVFYGQDAASRAGEYLPEEIPQDIFLPELY